MTLDEEIAWWTKQAFKSTTDAALVAFGVATGLKVAKRYYGAKDDLETEEPYGKQYSKD